MISIASYGKYDLSNNNNVAQIPKPSNLAVGDLLVAIVSGRDSIVASQTWTNTYTIFGNDRYGYSNVYTKYATSEDVALSYFAFNSGSYYPIGGIVYRIPNGNINDVQVGTATKTPTVSSNALLLFDAAFDDDSDSTTFSGYAITGGTSPTFTEDYDSYGSNAVSRISLGVASALYNSAGAITAITITQSNSTDYSNKRMILIGEIPLNPPTVTTQAVTDKAKTTGTGNGNITATGGENATRRGFCYIQGSSGDPTTADNVVYDDGSFGTGAYTKAITGLTPNTTYRVRAYAVNSAGTSYGSTVSFTTLKADESNFLLLF